LDLEERSEGIKADDWAACHCLATDGGVEEFDCRVGGNHILCRPGVVSRGKNTHIQSPKRKVVFRLGGLLEIMYSGPARATPWRSDADADILKKCWWSEGEGGGKEMVGDAEANWDGAPRNESVIKTK